MVFSRRSSCCYRLTSLLTTQSIWYCHLLISRAAPLSDMSQIGYVVAYRTRHIKTWFVYWTVNTTYSSTPSSISTQIEGLRLHMFSFHKSTYVPSIQATTIFSRRVGDQHRIHLARELPKRYVPGVSGWYYLHIHPIGRMSEGCLLYLQGLR